MNAILLVCAIILLFIIVVQSWKIVDSGAIIQGRHPYIEERFLYFFFGIPTVIGVFWLTYSLWPK